MREEERPGFLEIIEKQTKKRRRTTNDRANLGTSSSRAAPESSASVSTARTTRRPGTRQPYLSRKQQKGKRRPARPGRESTYPAERTYERASEIAHAMRFRASIATAVGATRG